MVLLNDSLCRVALALAVCSAKAAETQSKATRITKDGEYKSRPVWLPDGSRLLLAKHAGNRIDLVSVLPDGTDERRVFGANERWFSYDASVDASGKWIAFTRHSLASNQGDADICRAEISGAHVFVIAANEKKLSHEEWPTWSPDGQRIAFSTTAYGNQEIATADREGKNRKRLTEHPGTDSHPCFSPDGSTIVFSTDRWGGLEIAAMNADGSDVRRLTASSGLDDYPSFSPDGKRIAFVSNRDGNLEIYVMAADGVSPRNLSLSPGPDSHPCWTPDGKALVFVQGTGLKYDLVRMPVDD